MIDDDFAFTPPAERTMDPVLRAHLAQRVFTSIAQPRVTRRRGPVLAVAAVAVLAAISAVIATVIGHSVSSPATPSVSIATNLELARCAATADRAGFHGLDDQSTLTSIFSASGFGRQVTGLRIASGQAVFCETTATTVTISQPNQPSTVSHGAPARNLLESDDGVIAGLVPAGTTGLTVNVDKTIPMGGQGPYSSVGTATVSDGMFIFVGLQPVAIAPSMVTGEDKAITEDGGALPPGDHPRLTKAAPALTFAVDRPAPGATTPQLTQCLNGVAAGKHESVLDQASLSAGSTATTQEGSDSTKTVIAYNATQAATCSVSAGDLHGTSFLSSTRVPLTDQHPVQLLDSMANHWTDRFEFDGMIAANVGKITIASDGSTVDASITGPTFAAVIPISGDKLTVDESAIIVTILDTTGKTIYQGPISGASASS
jgi:hypothetical protein